MNNSHQVTRSTFSPNSSYTRDAYETCRSSSNQADPANSNTSAESLIVSSASSQQYSSAHEEIALPDQRIKVRSRSEDQIRSRSEIDDQLKLTEKVLEMTLEKETDARARIIQLEAKSSAMKSSISELKSSISELQCNLETYETCKSSSITADPANSNTSAESLIVSAASSQQYNPASNEEIAMPHQRIKVRSRSEDQIRSRSEVEEELKLKEKDLEMTLEKEIDARARIIQLEAKNSAMKSSISELRRNLKPLISELQCNLEQSLIHRFSRNPRNFGDDEAHPLPNNWTFCRWDGDQVKEDWDEGLQEGVTVRTVEEFKYLNHKYLNQRILLPSRLPPNIDYRFFKEGIKSSWADPQNEKGGYLRLKVPHLDKAKLDKYWQDLMKAAILDEAEAFGGIDINGIVVSIQQNSHHRIEVWFRDCKNSYSVKKIFNDKLGLDSRSMISFKKFLKKESKE